MGVRQQMNERMMVILARKFVYSIHFIKTSQNQSIRNAHNRKRNIHIDQCLQIADYARNNRIQS